MLLTRQIIVQVMTVILLAYLTAYAEAVPLIGINPIGGSAGTSLLNIQTNPFSVSSIGTAGGSEVLSGLDFDSRTRTLFASSGHGGAHPGSLFRVNLSTGAATLIGPTGFDGVPGLAFDLDGTLFGSTPVTSSLIRINRNTGVGLAVGTIGFAFVDAIAVDPTTGTLFGISDLAGNRLITINKTTGKGTSVGLITGAFNAAPADPIVGLTFDSQANLYGSLGRNFAAAEAGSIISINRDTLKFTILGDAANGAVSDITFISPEPKIIILLIIAAPVVLGCVRCRQKLHLN